MFDNTSDISVAKNPVFHNRMRHLERRPHLPRDYVEKGNIKMRYIDTERQLADIFIKPLDVTCFASLRGQGGLGVCVTPTFHKLAVNLSKLHYDCTAWHHIFMDFQNSP
jgi:hypothetical protein